MRTYFLFIQSQSTLLLPGYKKTTVLSAVDEAKQSVMVLPPAMPCFEQSEKNLSTSTLKDIQSQKYGLRHTVFTVSGNQYTGEWLNNKKHGNGTQVWRSGAIYDGEWKFGKRDGYGTYSVLLPKSKEHVRKYTGEWKNGKKHGYGVYFYNNSAVYEGEWREDQRSGKGRMYYENGDIYDGEWMKDKNHGQGVIIFSNGNWYGGTWQDGMRNGNGKLYYSDKGVLYEGFWVDGMAKCGTLSDFRRDIAPAPPKYPFPKTHLKDMDLVLREAKSACQNHQSWPSSRGTEQSPREQKVSTSSQVLKIK